MLMVSGGQYVMMAGLQLIPESHADNSTSRHRKSHVRKKSHMPLCSKFKMYREVSQN